MPDNDTPNPLAAADAASALAGLREPAEQAATAIDQAFERASISLSRSLAKAASDGKVSLAELARAAIGAADALARSGGSSSGGGLGEALASLISSVFSGARADGGPVTPGGAYLVGERGPELFRPASAGEIAPAPTAASGAVTVNLTVQGAGDPAAFVRSDAQLAQALARAAALGAR